MATTPPTGFADFLASSMPKYPDPSNWLSASMPRAADTTTTIPSESPPPTEWFITGDVAYKCAFLSYSKPEVAISAVRPAIVAAIPIANTDDAINILRQYLRGGTVAVLTKDGRTITANNVTLDDFKNLTTELGLPKNPDGSYLALVRISVASTDYRAN